MNICLICLHYNEYHCLCDEMDALFPFNCALCCIVEFGCTASRMCALPPKLAGKGDVDISLLLISISWKILNSNICVVSCLFFENPGNVFWRFGEVQTFDCLSYIVCRCRMRNGRRGSVVPLATTLLALLVSIYTGKSIHVTCSAL